jgi:3-oxoadipate enol-lactonase
MSFVEKTLNRNGLDIHYWMGGKASAPLVVLTHGATVDHTEWVNTLPLLTDDYRVLTWDMRGHGLSRPGLFLLQEAVNDLIAIMDIISAKEAIFIGHSAGGNLHQELVFYYPERVRAMACVDCTWNFQKLTPLEKLVLNSVRTIFNMYPYETLIEQSLEVTANSKEARDLLRSSMQNTSKEEYIQIMVEMTNCLHYEPGYRINKPLLLIMGKDDRTGNIRKAMPLWAKQEPQCQFFIIPNAKHAPNLDNPQEFHKHLLDFLKSL